MARPSRVEKIKIEMEANAEKVLKPSPESIKYHVWCDCTILNNKRENEKLKADQIIDAKDYPLVWIQTLLSQKFIIKVEDKQKYTQAELQQMGYSLRGPRALK